ncbi:MAG: hypothetical protein Sapg2KO_06970 [Saprospiraceae bacterium]
MSPLRERIEFLKSGKKLANTFLEVYKKAQNETGYKSWEKDVIFFNVKKLKEIILDINKMLSKSGLEEYISATNAASRIADGKKKSSDFPDDILRETFKGVGLHFKIVRYSPSYSIVFDLNWIKDGTVTEHMDIALGNQKMEVISSKYFDYRKDSVIECVQSYVKNHKIYSLCFEVLNSAMELSKIENYLASNILILTGIESLVRLLVNFILKFQYPELSEKEVENIAFSKYNSLETLIKKCEFKDDYPITLPEAIQLRDFVDDRSLDKCKEIYENHARETSKFRDLISKFMEKTESLKLIENNSQELIDFLGVQSEELKKINGDAILKNIHSEKYQISIRIKLYFLVRRLKDLRNDVVHGKFDEFSTKHYNYLSMAALYEVITLLKDYDKIYKK